MANKLRREKLIIERATSSYLKATTEDYLKYFQGSPSYITYYQTSSLGSSQDVNLETVHSLVGKNTPKKYKKIEDVICYGVDYLEISNEINERGLLSNINGELIFLPNTIIPYADDFFIFDYDGLREHLFKITDVQYDKATPEKYFRVQFSLYQNNTEDIFNNIEDDYNFIYENIGGELSTIVKKSATISSEEGKKMVDSIIKKYTNIFYSDDLDTFLYTGELNGIMTYFWSPYSQHFIHKNKIFKKYEKKLLDDFYIMDINQFSNPQIFNEETYSNSIFKKVELKDGKIDLYDDFLSIQTYDLKNTRNLPFFNSSLEYKSIEPVKFIKEKNTFFRSCENAFSMTVGNPENLFGKVDHFHKIHIADSAHVNHIKDHLKDGDYIYECFNNEIEITKMFLIKRTGEELELIDKSLNALLSRTDEEDSEEIELFKIINSYLEKKLELNEDLLTKLNRYSYDNSLKNYFLLPIVIFIIKDLISNVFEK